MNMTARRVYVLYTHRTSSHKAYYPHRFLRQKTRDGRLAIANRSKNALYNELYTSPRCSVETCHTKLIDELCASATKQPTILFAYYYVTCALWRHKSCSTTTDKCNWQKYYIAYDKWNELNHFDVCNKNGRANSTTGPLAAFTS